MIVPQVIEPCTETPAPPESAANRPENTTVLPDRRMRSPGLAWLKELAAEMRSCIGSNVDPSVATPMVTGLGLFGSVLPLASSPVGEFGL